MVIIPRASIISKNEVSSTVLCLQCSPSYTAVWIKNCLKNTSFKVATMKNMMVPHAPVIVWNCPISLLCQLCSTCYTAIQINSCLKSTFVIKIATMKKYGRFAWNDFRYAKEVITCNHQINAIHCQQRWMEHKGGLWQVPEECIGRTAVCQRHLSGWNEIEQWKNQAHSLNCYWVMLVWRHQLVTVVSQSAENSVI